jgi:hypothetical protein
MSLYECSIGRSLFDCVPRLMHARKAMLTPCPRIESNHSAMRAFTLDSHMVAQRSAVVEPEEENQMLVGTRTRER